MTENQLARNFTPKEICAYAAPTMFMMIFMSAYMIVDGMFVAKYVNELAFSALNMVYPVISTVLALGLMLSIGGSAVIATLLGEGKNRDASEFLSQIYLLGLGLGILCTLVTLVFLEEILQLLQASGLIYPYAREYLLYTGVFFLFATLQVFAQTFFVTAGKPLLGFLVCFAGGITNILLDYLFLAKLQLGIKGAALGTGIGFGVPGLIALGYFLFSRKGSLYFVKFRWDCPKILLACSNGMSECVTNMSVAIITYLFNIILLDMAGEAGVSAYTAILYIQMFQLGVYTGFSIGVSPIISYKYGAKDQVQLQKVVKTSLYFIGFASLLVIGFSYLFAEEAVSIFIPKNSETFAMAKEGLLIYSVAYLFMGFNIMLSALFTALSNGKISAFLSFSRNLFFILVSVMVMPRIYGLQGVWMAVPVAEFVSLVIGLVLFQKYRKKYHY